MATICMLLLLFVSFVLIAVICCNAGGGAVGRSVPRRDGRGQCVGDAGR